MSRSTTQGSTIGPIVAKIQSRIPASSLGYLNKLQKSKSLNIGKAKLNLSSIDEEAEENNQSMISDDDDMDAKQHQILQNASHIMDMNRFNQHKINTNVSKDMDKI